MNSDLFICPFFWEPPFQEPMDWRYPPCIRSSFQALISGDISRTYGRKYGTNLPTHFRILKISHWALDHHGIPEHDGRNPRLADSYGTSTVIHSQMVCLLKDVAFEKNHVATHWMDSYPLPFSFLACGKSSSRSLTLLLHPGFMGPWPL